jgi:predicted lipoprotein with Yx(FWY)xxD motif
MTLKLLVLGILAFSSAPATAPAQPGAKVRIVDSRFGRVVADGKGEALYLFTKERNRRSRCYGACADAWPPALTKGDPVAGSGTRAGLLGTTRRSDGKLQITYAGHPLYYYVGDSPGNILCQDVFEFGGTWLVVKPSGTAVR